MNRKNNVRNSSNTKIISYRENDNGKKKYETKKVNQNNENIKIINHKVDRRKRSQNHENENRKRKLNHENENRKRNLNHENENRKRNLNHETDNGKGKHSIVFPIIVLILGFALGAFFYTNKSDGANVIKKYYACLKERNYDQMYELVDTALSKEEFVNRVKNIYEGIDIQDIKVSIMGNMFIREVNVISNSDETDEAKSNNYETNLNNDVNASDVSTDNNTIISNWQDTSDEIPSVTYNVSAKCVAGDFKFTRTSNIVKKDGEVKIKWTSADIYPDLGDDEKIRVRQIEAKRGTIFDRNGYTLAKDSEAYLARIVPSKVNSSTSFSKISELTGVDANNLRKEVNEENNTDENNNSTNEKYINLMRFSKENQDLKNKLLEIKGVLITDVKAREYPRGEAFAVMLGYVQDGEGKVGVEKQFNDILKAQNGCEIYIEDKNGNIKKSLSKRNPKNGNDIKLTIDSSIQEKIYNQFKDDKSAVVEINYNTGEILALVSTPSYDNNKFSLGMSDEEWNTLKNDEARPMYARFLATYVPGSSIKPLVSAIGLETNAFKADDDFGNYNLKWQKDKSWGDFYITTLKEDRGENTVNNLKNALVYSDNIYFAQAALKIDKTKLCYGFDNFGFNASLDFIDDMQKSQYGEITTDKDVASTGFGQANLMVNPILMSSIYSCFVNEGNMIKPYIELEKEESAKTKFYKQNVISQSTANIIKEDLIQVVKIGTGMVADIEGKTIAGKTGTAEIKASKHDKNGTEIGWFDAFDDKENLIISMVENVEKKGGSGYVVKKVAEILKE